jgi:thermosome
MSQSGDRQRMRAGGQPVFVLSEDAERTQGEDAQQANVSAGKAVAEAVRTTLGPNGMDKMLVSDGDVVVTNDGATILDEMEIEHPAADMIVEVAESQDDETGDGTTTVAVLTGELLAKAEDLLDDDVHPTAIAEGYAQARDIAVETLESETLAGELDDERLRRVAESAMTGKSTGGATADQLAAAVVEAVRRVERDGTVDADDVQVVARSGRSSTATEVVEGVAIDDEPAREDAPRRYEDATVAVVDQDLEQPETNVDVEYDIADAAGVESATAGEQSRLRRAVDTLVDAVYCTGEVDDYVAAALAEHDVLVFDNCKDREAPAFADATGAARITDLAEADAEDFGHADTVRRERYDDEELTFVESADAAVVTLFVRGGTGYVVDELERAVSDGVDGVVGAVTGGGVVPGAGASEVAVANALRDRAAGIEGRQQLAVEAFAEAVEALPRTLAQNAGMDPIDALVDLRAANETGRAGVLGVGSEARVADPVEAGVLDPLSVKRGAVTAATEAATMIVRIDDVISAN